MLDTVSCGVVVDGDSGWLGAVSGIDVAAGDEMGGGGDWQWNRVEDRIVAAKIFVVMELQVVGESWER
ncbi:MAG: hypothetical protein LAT76_08065 [Schleiferiaceae bacterium]|nr:hypothetical protein [Schleiferiaceae bacterium]